MQRTLVIDQKEYPYTLKRRKYQRRVNMIVHQDGTLVVTAPKMVTLSSIEKTLGKNAVWLHKNLGERQQYKITIDPIVMRHIKKATRRLVHVKLEDFNVHYNFSYNRVAIRGQTTVWGSCSAKGNLNFNYKIFCLPEHLQDYIIVHELCHLRELNHSQKFWNLVIQKIPDYKDNRRALKKTSM